MLNFFEEVIIGEGVFGMVYKVVMGDGEVIVIKKIKCSGDREKSGGDSSFWFEILILGKIRYRNIVRFYGFCYY